MCKKYFGIILITLCMFFGTVFASTAKATGAGDQSNSPGTQGQKPLSFVGITLVAGGENVANATDIPLNPKFSLLFDKNVANSLFWENNYKCFSLTSVNNEKIAINVTKVDDTIDISQRQNIYVQPVSSLKPGTTYYLFISPNLRAKNGVSTLGGTTNGQGVTITFKTAGKAIQQAAATKTSSGDKAKKTTVANPNSMKEGNNGNLQGKEGSKTAAAASDNANSSAAFSNWLTIVGVILIVAWAAAEIYLRQKRKKK